MSVNNLLKIRKINHTGNPVFELDERDADTGERIGKNPIGIFNDLEEAIKAANDYMKENEVDYNLDIQV